MSVAIVATWAAIFVLLFLIRARTRRAEVVTDLRERLMDWLRERHGNCLRLAAEKNGADQAGWLEDATYFDQALTELERQETHLALFAQRAAQVVGNHLRKQLDGHFAILAAETEQAILALAPDPRALAEHYAALVAQTLEQAAQAAELVIDNYIDGVTDEISGGGVAKSIRALIPAALRSQQQEHDAKAKEHLDDYGRTPHQRSHDDGVFAAMAVIIGAPIGNISESLQPRFAKALADHDAKIRREAQREAYLRCAEYNQATGGASDQFRKWAKEAGGGSETQT